LLEFFLFFLHFGRNFFYYSLRRIDIYGTVRPVNGNNGSVLNVFKQPLYSGNYRNIQSFGDNGYMHRRRAFFYNQTPDFFIVIIHQIRRPHRCCDNYNIRIVVIYASIAIFPAQVQTQTVSYIAQIVQTLFQIRIGCS